MKSKILAGSILTFKFLLLFFLIILAVYKKELGVTEKIAELRLYSDFHFGVDLLVSLTVIYMLMLFIPFIPASELGISMMVIFGQEGVIYVYFSSLVCMGLGFLLGKNLNIDKRDRLKKSTVFNLLFNPKSYEVFERNSFSKRVPSSLQVAAFLNLPGNIVLGGGGGISFMYGFLGRVSIAKFALGISLGLAPIPLLIYFTGS